MEETTPILLKEKESEAHITDEAFRRQSHVLMASLLTALAVFLGVQYTIAKQNVVLFSVLVIINVFLFLAILVFLHGFYIWNRGSLPLEKDEEAKYIEVITDFRRRVIEYYVWGSEREDATPLVALHGSGTTGKLLHQHLFRAEELKRMNVKVISPSFPGHGGSDVHRYRRITDWPRSDLVPILDEEKIDKFLLIGSSYGTAHAMATASAIPGRCLAMGLNVPYLPEAICREAGMWTDADMILREQQLEKPWILLSALSFLSLVQGLLPSGIKALKEGKQTLKECPDLIDALTRDTARCFVRGVNGQAYEMMNAETTQTWPDPREIIVKHIAVWYAEDDGAVPPDHGKWLAENLQSMHRNLHVKNDKTGFGHFTYMTPEHCKTGVMTQVLLNMISSK